MNKNDLVTDFIDFIKQYDITEKGRITSSTIKEIVPYSERHFNRIFKEYSKYTPLEIAERFRLLCCIESIKKGNTLKDTAYDYDYTPEALSNLIRTKMKIDVKKIRKANFEVEKHLKISNLMIQLDEFKYQLSLDNFMMLQEGLNGEKILKTIKMYDNTSKPVKAFDLNLDSRKIMALLNKYESLEIDKRIYENIELQEVIVMKTILEHNISTNGFNEFTMGTDEILSVFFLLNFFFNISSLKLKKGRYRLIVNQELQEVLRFVEAFENAVAEPLDIMLHSVVKGEKVTVEFNWLYIGMLLEINNNNH